MKLSEIRRVFGLAILIMSFATTAAALQLLSMQEASLDDEPVRGIAHKASPMMLGPTIKVINPDTGKEVRSPLKLVVRFVPQDGRKVDLDTLKVECLKIITIDLTDRVRPFAKADGINVQEVDIPSGKHKIRISIADNQGGFSQETIVLKVP
jgi:hypothetical protein